MSTLIYDNISENIGYERSIHDFAPTNDCNFLFLSMNCIGQDAGYILRKRAMLLDLWNLLPDMSTIEKNYSDIPTEVDLPINIKKSHDYWINAGDKNIPVQ